MFDLWSKPKPVEIPHDSAKSLENDPSLIEVYVHPDYIEPPPIKRDPPLAEQPEPPQVIDNVSICEMNTYYCCLYCCARRVFFGQYEQRSLDMIGSYVFSPNGWVYIGQFRQEHGQQWHIDRETDDPEYTYCFPCALCRFICCYFVCYELCYRRCCNPPRELSLEERGIFREKIQR